MIFGIIIEFDRLKINRIVVILVVSFLPIDRTKAENRTSGNSNKTEKVQVLPVTMANLPFSKLMFFI